MGSPMPYPGHRLQTSSTSSPYLTDLHSLKSIIAVVSCHHPFLPPPNHLLPPHLQASHQHRLQMPQPHPQPSRAPNPSRVLYIRYFVDFIHQVVCSRQLCVTWRPSMPRFLSLSRRKRMEKVSMVNLISMSELSKETLRSNGGKNLHWIPSWPISYILM